MIFNELNSVENFIIQVLSGVNLNKDYINQNLNSNKKWLYKPQSQIVRNPEAIIDKNELKKSLSKINSVIKNNPDFADEIIFQLEKIIYSVKKVGLVKANEEIFEWLSGNKTMPFGKNNQHVSINLIDFKNFSNNSYVITNQFKTQGLESKVPDIVMMINGIPVVVGEAKTPIRPSISWLDGAHEIHDIYEIQSQNYLYQIFYHLLLKEKSYFMVL